MSHVPHELSDEFPEHKAQIHTLKLENAHFAKLTDEYHHINREIHRVEANNVNVADETFEDLKKKRLQLKDEIFSFLDGEG